MRRVINVFQAILIAFWMGFCGLLGIVLVLLTWQQNRVMLFLAHYFWSPVICAISGVRVKVTGLENLDKKTPSIYVANHSSLYDIVAICRASPVPLFYIAKKELAKVPIVGQFMWVIGMIFIDRKNKEKAMQSMRKAGQRIREGKSVISFPEGTRSKDGKIGIFKRGSFIIAKSQGIPVVPIAVKGAAAVLSAGSMGLRPGVIAVHFEKPIPPSFFEGKSEEEIAALTREIVAKRVDLMTTT